MSYIFKIKNWEYLALIWILQEVVWVMIFFQRLLYFWLVLASWGHSCPFSTFVAHPFFLQNLHTTIKHFRKNLMCLESTLDAWITFWKRRDILYLLYKNGKNLLLRLEGSLKKKNQRLDPKLYCIIPTIKEQKKDVVPTL